MWLGYVESIILKKKMEETTNNPENDSKKEDMDTTVNTENTENSAPERDMSPERSQYGSADSYSDEENVKVRSRASDPDNHTNSESGGSVILEREEGDGQESVPVKKIDDDEDKKNPQYIPKRGTFYEHDDRTVDEVEAAQEDEDEKEKEGKKKVWQDKKEKWAHDRYNEAEQAPKSRAELIDIYGYDIRNEEGPPRARRRRRYGRGPNKYTRNWEDEEAYNKALPKVRTTKKPSRLRKGDEEFPPLIQGDITEAQSVNETREQWNDSGDIENKNIVTVSHQVEEKRNEPKEVQQPSEGKFNRVGSGRMMKQKKEIKDSDYKGFTSKTRQQRNIKVDQQKVLTRTHQPQQQQIKPDYIQSHNFTNKMQMQPTTQQSIHDMEREMSKLTVDGVYKGGPKHHHNQRQGSVPPRMQPSADHSKGSSKRYSSMRQRSLPEANTPPATAAAFQPTTFYPNEYGQQQPPQPPSAAATLHQSPGGIPATAPPQLMPAQFQTAGYPPPGAAPPPAAFVAAPPPGAYIPAPQPQPPQTVAGHPAQMLNFVQVAAAAAAAAAAAGQAPPQFAAPPPPPPNFQGYQQQFSPVAQPTELYQPQGGITYYSADQQVGQRPVPQKRPKAAIPIVAPPDKEDVNNKSIGGGDVVTQAIEDSANNESIAVAALDGGDGDVKE